MVLKAHSQQLNWIILWLFCLLFWARAQQLNKILGVLFTLLSARAMNESNLDCSVYVFECAHNKWIKFGLFCLRFWARAQQLKYFQFWSFYLLVVSARSLVATTEFVEEPGAREWGWDNPILSDVQKMGESRRKPAIGNWPLKNHMSDLIRIVKENPLREKLVLQIKGRTASLRST